MWKTLHLTTIDLTAYCFLRPWLRRLRQEGHQVVVACTVERFRQDLEEVADRVIHLPIPRRIEPWGDLKALVQLVKLLRRERPDLIHTHTSKAGFLGRLAGRLAGVPVVLHTIHELPQNAVTSPRAKLVYRQMERLAALWADHLVTVSYANQRQILAEGICSEGKLTTIREGLELEQYQPRKSPDQVRRELGLPAQGPLLGMSARLERAKGHIYLLQAFRQILAARPECTLVLSGTGHLEAELKEVAREFGPRVVFAGWIEDLVSFMASLDVFVLSSLYEGLGIVLLEAMAVSRPVVSTAVGGTTDVVVDGVTGYLVPPRSPEALAARVLELLAEPERASEMGRQGRLRVEREFLSSVADDRMLELYSRLMPWGT